MKKKWTRQWGPGPSNGFLDGGAAADANLPKALESKRILGGGQANSANAARNTGAVRFRGVLPVSGVGCDADVVLVLSSSSVGAVVPARMLVA